MIEISQYLFYKIMRLVNIINLNNIKLNPVSTNIINYKKSDKLS
jgi:hypothetical protein